MPMAEFVFFFKQETAYEISACLVGSEMCIRDSLSTDSTQTRPVEDSTEEPEVHFVSFVLDDTQRTWTQIFQQQGRSYRHAKLVLFRDAVDSACGMAQSATGPFYCPDDEKVYIDLS